MLMGSAGRLSPTTPIRQQTAAGAGNGPPPPPPPPPVLGGPVFDAISSTVQIMMQDAECGLVQHFASALAAPGFDSGTAVTGRMEKLAADISALLRGAMDVMFLQLSISEREFVRVVHAVFIDIGSKRNF